MQMQIQYLQAMDLTPGIKELHIISYNITWYEGVLAYIAATGILIAIAIGIYDKWFNNKGD